MARKILVDPAKLEGAARKIDQQVIDYKGQYQKLFSQVEAMGQAWRGADNVAFVNQISQFRDDLTRMETVLKNYSDFLKKSAGDYKNTQNDRIGEARKLKN